MTQVGWKASCIVLAKNSSFSHDCGVGSTSRGKNADVREAGAKTSLLEWLVRHPTPSRREGGDPSDSWRQGGIHAYWCQPDRFVLKSSSTMSQRRKPGSGGPPGWERNGTAPTPPTLTSNPAVMASPVPPSRKTLLHLYAATLRASRGFSSYNFRNYFLARTKDAFRGIQVRNSPISCLPASRADVPTGLHRMNQTRLSSHHSTAQP